MAHIGLDRQFFPWEEGELSEPDAVLQLGRSVDLLGWESVSARRRVVIMAEAGSGKTAEMREQARLRREAGQLAFYATVEDVGEDGLENSLASEDRTRLVSWRDKSTESAWFFIDSVDEAKRRGIRFGKALRRIADGLGVGARRAHVILSVRLTDWEFRRDLKQLEEGLVVPNDPVLPPPPSAEQVLISALRHERPKPTSPVEKPLVVVMVPLNSGRVRKFAAEKGAPNLDGFLAQIEAANLWRFARRPLDLDWLVEFWESQRRLGTLEEMLENSLTARLREKNLDRAREDGLDETRALQAVERIGAALVFEGKTTIAIPDGELVLSNDERALDVALVLSDWPSNDHMQLLTRPVFDPATFGRVRLHNDNEGVVRSYLAARWLRRLRKTNLSHSELFGSLFAKTYGIELIKPSMQETAAWLAIWDDEVAGEIIKRDPSLLLTAGDPASLATSLRGAALTAVVDLLAVSDRRLRLLDHDILSRFARPDLAEIIRSLWSRHHGQDEARRLLLRLIALGKLQDCADLAVTAFYTYPDKYTRLVTGRALAAVGDKETKRAYVDFIKNNCGTLPSLLIWEAVNALFPDSLDVDDLLAILSAVDFDDSDGGVGFGWESPALVDRLGDRFRLERLLRGLLLQLGDEEGEIGRIPNKREESYLVGIAATAFNLLEHSTLDEASDDCIDAVLQLGVRLHYHRSVYEIRNVVRLLHRSSARRRLAFWRAAEQLSRNRLTRGQPIQELYQMEIIGYPPGLKLEDAAWLLDDAPKRVNPSERRLALNVALFLWKQAGSPADLLSQIEWLARSDATMQQIYDNWLNPPPPSAEWINQQKDMERERKLREAEHAARDRSWLDFVAELKNDPNQLRRIHPTADSIDRRLYLLWELLRGTIDANTHFAIDSVSPLEPMLGKEVALALQDALIQYWRFWQPQLRSAKSPNELNQIRTMDLMGLAGVSLEARNNPHWADKLSHDEAVRAAAYATLELSGYPPWLPALAATKPDEVRQVLLGEFLAELKGAEPKTRYEVLERLAWAETPVVELVADGVFETLAWWSDPPTSALEPMLSIVMRGLTRSAREQLSECVLSRFNATNDPRIAGLYLGAAYAVDVTVATDALTAKLNALPIQKQTALVEQILPQLFGTDRRHANARVDLPFACLERLVSIAFDAIRREDDINRPSGKVYSPSVRASRDLQRVALRRLDDIQNDLLHADFAQGATVKSLPNEKAVQIWMAERLRLVQGRSYSVEREPHVVEEKEPDVRLRAKTSDSSVPIEVKVPESWTLEQLEAALTDQLCGRYLRARDARHGILLLVHQKPRPIGWKNSADGSKLTIGGIASHLKRRAAELCGISPDAPQPEIALVDVSCCAHSKPKRAALKKAAKTRQTGRRRTKARAAN